LQDFIAKMRTIMLGNDLPGHVAAVEMDAADMRMDIADRRKDFVLANIDGNPLPASLEVKLSDARQAKRFGDELRAEVGGGVIADVIDNPQVVDQLLTITRVLSVGGVAILAMMLFVALFVIVNTIRIAVHARRDEIEIMQLVGAADWFVSWPFILEGMLVGTFGALVALAVLAAASQPVTTAMVGFLDILPVSLGTNFVLELAAGVLGFALVVGGFGASFSVRSQLSKGAQA